MTTAEQDQLRTQADAAALMLASADDREALDATLKALTFHDAAKLLVAVLEVAGTVVRIGDATGETSRDLLARLIAACRDLGVE